ncbi:hypothetical protein AMAG_02743 [Allomyces macrogynus ATCC 38327]|uniref:Cytosol aminopeptidase domain-containing protein n=1 Tax=Allomyces macrogynus (strain ATCC 38327) TaxID=578462 RepID=A0A0L0S3N0_ALLM3|nr:hypothetical protein AMAG_02743 [Allomyces macrogynus ATCC 38327]|eukprot:KNE56979.1 hypothetical protein AMAG_02743 [Allomyces macrogynus ATCC 38327]
MPAPITHVAFGPHLASAPEGVRAKVVLGPKGSLKLDAIPALTESSAFSSLAVEAAAPLHLPEGERTASVTLWTTGEDGAAERVTLAHFCNKKSRNMGVLRSDKLRAAAETHVPATGDALVVVVVENAAEAFAAGLAVAKNWPLYTRKTGGERDERTVYVDFAVADGSEVDYDELTKVAKAVRDTQRRVDTAPCELTTSIYVEEAKALVERLDDPNVSITIIQGEDLREQGFGGLWGVGKAAEFPPALVVLSHVPETVEKTVALVGKGIVYDCGGLSLKPTASMTTMKSDMGGSAAVLGAFEALVTTGAAPTTAVHALLCLAENAIDAKAYKNDDILTLYSGKTVEIVNTDAEGRLVLGDGVAYASKHLNPDVVVDIATLTGAQFITTGTVHAAVLTADEEVEAKIVAAGKTTGDLTYPMIYAKELLMPQFESKVADMTNSVKDRMCASSAAAGHFVEAHLDAEFTGAGKPFLHVDIAGPSMSAGRATGHGAALLYQFTKNF